MNLPLQPVLLGLALLAVVVGAAWAVSRAARMQALLEALQQQLAAQRVGEERLERELRLAIEAAAGAARQDTGLRLGQLQTALASQLTQTSGVNAEQLGAYGRLMQQQLGEIRTTLEQRLQALQEGNEARLERMRVTVEEKLQTTLDTRLGESFKLVSQRLEQVHQGLGEMQTLAAGVGDLKRVLGNVKVRGIVGEVQLGALLEQVLLPDQYAANLATRPGASERVDYAVKLPGRAGDESVWLPIDAKFPLEDYERLLLAQERGDAAAVEEAARALEARIMAEARSIRDKYVAPPHTTDFAILFLPTEGLFAEVLRRPGLIGALNRERRVVIAGPTTLFAMLNTLQMGFRTLAIEQRSAEVWKLLGAVKTEFSRFGDWLLRVRDQVRTVSNTLDQADTRARQMQRALKQVEELPAGEAAQMLPPVEGVDEGG